MNTEKILKKDLYYTNDHEWIDFQGTVAYTGVCHFKLLGFKGIHNIQFIGAPGFKRRGEVIAIIKYNDYQIGAHMPVDGKVVALNETFFSLNPDLLLQQAESAGWIALIAPSQPYERKNLLLPKQYQVNGKGKYAK
jgi:glycine cleavage system H protein